MQYASTPKGHDFPVSLQPVYTKDNQMIPTVRAVVREDTHMPIATVSNRYQLFKHEEVLEQADEFIKWFGKPERSIFTAKNGASMTSQFTYKEVTADVKVGDTVGFRVHISNSYDGKSSLLIRVGSIRLICLNGMVSATNYFTGKFKHVKGVEVELPDPKDVFTGWSNSIDKWKELTTQELSKNEYGDFGQSLMDESLLPKSFGNSLYQNYGTNPSAWGLYNDATAFITHTSKAQEVGKINRLSRVDNWFDQNFLSAKVH